MVGGNTFMPMGGTAPAKQGPLPVGELTVGDGTNPAATGNQGVISPGSPEHQAIDKRIEERKPELEKIAKKEQEKKKTSETPDPAAKSTSNELGAAAGEGLSALGAAVSAQAAADAQNKLQAPAAHRGQVSTPDLSFKGKGALAGMGGAF